jgi:membrane protein DedA with SNARE-associated domain
LEGWIRDLLVIYSYWAIVVLVAVEGDITLLLAGMLAHERLLGFGFGTAFVAAMAGAVGGDIFAFLLGRHVRKNVSESKIYKKFHPRFEWMEQKFGFLSIILVKWLYGMRFASSLFWGVSRMGAWRFSLLTIMSCCVWVLSLISLGWLFGTAVSTFLSRFQSVAAAVIVTIVGLVALRAIHHWWISPRLQEEAEKAGFTQELQAESAPVVAMDEPDAKPVQEEKKTAQTSPEEARVQV